MRKLFYTLSAFILFPLFASPAKAQRVELFGGYSYAQINPGGFETQNASGTGTHFSLSGWEVSGAVNANRWIGLVADFAGYPGTKAVDVLTAEHLRYYTYMAGPQVRLRGVGPFTFFAHGLVGAAHSNNDIPILTANFKETRLAFAAGGGVDISMGKHVALRALQVDYLGNSFSNLDINDNPISGRQRNARASAGIVFKF
jgi:opacity protein-like surface antigen